MREEIVEVLADFDEEIATLFLEGEPVSEALLRRALRKHTIALDVIPVLCGSAFKNKGVQPLLDAVVDYLPSPLDLPDIVGIDPDTSGETSRACSNDAPFSALAFKIMVDPFVGRLVFCRIYSGSLENGVSILNASTNKRERVGRILRMHANKREEMESAHAGLIVALPGLKPSRTGDTLCDEKAPILLESLEFPEPVISLAVEP
jgi:elongation factor G